MKTIQEKITFALAALLYLLFHLRGGHTAAEILSGTAMQLLTTLSYCIGFTFIFVRIIRHLHHGKQPAWDRIARIFFSIGIFFSFFFGLYEYVEQAQQIQSTAPIGAAANCANAARRNSHAVCQTITPISISV